MPAKELNTLQRAALLTLMVVDGPIANADLKATYGIDLTGKHRLGLRDAGLITSEKVGRGFVHELTDKGWAACADQLGAEPPARSGSFGKTLYTVLGGLRAYLDRSGLRLADVFGTLDAPADPSATTVEDRVRDAYRKLAPHPGAWVALADLRRQIDGVPAHEVDEALKALHRSPRGNLVPEANQKALTAEDRIAAVHVGGEEKHHLSIEEP